MYLKNIFTELPGSAHEPHVLTIDVDGRRPRCVFRRWRRGARPDRKTKPVPTNTQDDRSTVIFGRRRRVTARPERSAADLDHGFRSENKIKAY